MTKGYQERFPDTSNAAASILPHLFEIAGPFVSAVDVGGGTGAWCVTLKQLGVSRVVCIDHPEVRPDLLIDPSEFLACDMAKAFPSPVRYDLVLCLEFAEHLPKVRGEGLIDFLTASGDVILFSAAIPGQPSRYHVNEQPPEDWRTLFAQRGFERFDCVRPRIVSDTQLPYWYRQNLYVYASRSAASERKLRTLPFSNIPSEFELIHSRVLQGYRSRRLPQAADVREIFKRSLQARLNRI